MTRAIRHMTFLNIIYLKNKNEELGIIMAILLRDVTISVPLSEKTSTYSLNLLLFEIDLVSSSHFQQKSGYSHWGKTIENSEINSYIHITYMLQDTKIIELFSVVDFSSSNQNQDLDSQTSIQKTT